jgi:putative oxidoreductase
MPLAGWIETIGGALLVVGLFSRPAAFILSGETAVIYFIAHAPSGLFPIANGGEAAVLFSWTFLYIVFAGPGSLSLDRLFARRLGTAP